MKICFENPEPVEACATPTALVAFHTTLRKIEKNKIILACLSAAFTVWEKEIISYIIFKNVTVCVFYWI